MGKIKQAIEEIYAGVVLHIGNREPQRKVVELADVHVQAQPMRCKKCVHGTIRRNEHGRPKGYCKEWQTFTQDKGFCTTFEERK